MRKLFSIEAVLAVTTGFVLDDKGLPPIHEVFQHLFPGIPVGHSLIFAAEGAKKAIFLQRPDIVGLSNDLEKRLNARKEISFSVIIEQTFRDHLAPEGITLEGPAA